MALMGASGSGKSTLMNILGCLDHATAGEYWLDGQEMSKLTPNERALVRTGNSASFSRASICCRGLRRSKRPDAAGLFARGFLGAEKPAGWRRALLNRVGLADRAHHVRRKCPADSNNGWRSAARLSTVPRCCWPTNRQATSIRTRASKSCGCSSSSTPRESPSFWSRTTPRWPPTPIGPSVSWMEWSKATTPVIQTPTHLRRATATYRADGIDFSCQRARTMTVATIATATTSAPRQYRSCLTALRQP